MTDLNVKLKIAAVYVSKLGADVWADGHHFGGI